MRAPQGRGGCCGRRERGAASAFGAVQGVGCAGGAAAGLGRAQPADGVVGARLLLARRQLRGFQAALQARLLFSDAEELAPLGGCACAQGDHFRGGVGQRRDRGVGGRVPVGRPRGGGRSALAAHRRRRRRFQRSGCTKDRIRHRLEKALRFDRGRVCARALRRRSRGRSSRRAPERMQRVGSGRARAGGAGR